MRIGLFVTCLTDTLAPDKPRHLHEGLVASASG